MKEYWSLLDRPPQPPTPEVAAALVRSFLSIDDYGIQQPAELALRSFPHLLSMDALLANIEDLESGSHWASYLVDLFADDLSPVELQELADRVLAAPPGQAKAYQRALLAAEDDGSEHAEALLAAIAAASEHAR